MKIVKLLLVVSSAILASCANIELGGSDPEDVVKNKAAFILDCSKENIRTQCINEVGFISKDCIEYGVTGCGQRSVYSKIGSSWVMTSGAE